MICPKCGHDLSTEKSVALSGNALSLILDAAAELRSKRPPAGFGVDAAMDEHHPSDDGHGDDGRLLAGP